MDFSMLKKLAIFALVVQQGSFISAARKIGTSRSRVSEQISELEDVLSVRLLHRTTRQLTLTAEGRDIYEHAKGLQSILDHIEEASQNNLMKGRIRMTVTNDVGVKNLAEHIVNFSTLYPDIEIDLVANDQRLDLIANGIDLGIRIGMPRNDSIVGRSLLEQRPQIMVSPIYLERTGLLDTWDGDPYSLAHEKWVLLKQMSPNNEICLYSNDAQYPFIPDQFHVCDSPILAHTLVTQGLGLGLFLPATLKQELSTGQLVQLAQNYTGEVLLITLVYPSRKNVPVRVRALIDYLLAQKVF